MTEPTTNNPLRRSPLASVLVAVAVVVVAVFLGAIVVKRSTGSTGTSQTFVPGARGTVDGAGGGSTSFAQFRSCMAKNGVTMQRGSGTRPDGTTFQKALQACAQYAPPRPNGGPGGPRGFGGAPQGVLPPQQQQRQGSDAPGTTTT